MNFTTVLIIAGIVIVVIVVILLINKSKSDDADEEVITAKQKLPPLPDFASRDPQTGEMTMNFHFDESESKEGVYLFVDVETTGLPKSTAAYADNLVNFPRVVQISWYLADADFKCVNSETCYLKQDAPIPPSSTKIHGITDEMIAEKGEDPKAAFERLLVDINKAMYIVAHNIDFDIPVIESEFLRFGMKKPFRDKKKICTMKEGTRFCEIPKYQGKGYKYPKLEELLEYCYFPDWSNLHITEAHNSQVDVVLTIKCFIKLKELGYIEL